MGSRLELHNELMKFTSNVYFQAPTNTSISYPAIMYTRRSMDRTTANNNVYKMDKTYMITVMDRSPDSPLLDKVLSLPMCRHDRHYISDGLHHDTFIIYY